MAKLARHADEVMDAVFTAARRLREGMPENMGNQSRKIKEIIDKTKKTDSDMAGSSPKPKPKPKPDNPKPDVPPFKPNGKHDSSEFRRQLQEQWDALRNMDLATWKRNREAYRQDGRSPASEAAQQAARVSSRRRMERELRNSDPHLFDANGNPKPELADALDDWMSTQAALHRLDGIAGGNATDISGLGDANVNSSLGSQWRTRVDALDGALEAFMQANPGVDLSDFHFDLPDLQF